MEVHSGALPQPTTENGWRLAQVHSCSPPLIPSRGLGEWLFVLGTYSVTRSLCTSGPRYLPLFSQAAMPFYLTHQQVLITMYIGNLAYLIRFL